MGVWGKPVSFLTQDSPEPELAGDRTSRPFAFCLVPSAFISSASCFSRSIRNTIRIAKTKRIDAFGGCLTCDQYE